TCCETLHVGPGYWLIIHSCSSFEKRMRLPALIPLDAVGCTKTTSVGLRIEDSSSQATNLKKRLWNPPEKVSESSPASISEVKNDILHHLKEKDVLVVCGETGSGKTTQVPQFILDDMIDSGHGGYCNIICTQPRRIAVIIATNIAETSITIDDVVYVIDSGKHKEDRYNPQKKLSSMVEDWISKANARQRAGRAGRVRPGHCFSLYTRHRFEKRMRPYQALEAPSESAIHSAISWLRKTLLYGAIFGCLSPILSIAAFLSEKSPFVYPKDEKQNVDRVKLALLSDKLESSSNINNNDKQSDHLLMIVAYEKWVKILHKQGNQAAERFCDSNFLSSSVMQMISDVRIQLGTLLADIGLINLPKSNEYAGRRNENLDVWFSDKTQPFNMYSQEPEVVKAILCAGLCPNIAEGMVNRLTKPEQQTQRYAVWHDGRREVHIHPNSINKSCKAFQYSFLVFLVKVESRKVVSLRDTTIVSPLSILLFGGSVDVHHQELRLTLHSILKDLIRKPEKSGIVHNEVVKSMVHLLIEEGKPQPKTALGNED
ncbi:unnamed protein product, partial [Thlaspi arvense]